jgi:mRNA interferase MazF
VALPQKGKITGVVLADQLRSLDWRARKAEFAAKAPADTVEEALAKLRTLV